MSQEIIWKETEGGLKAFVRDSLGYEDEVTWAPQPGSQEAFLECPVFECLYEGTRGPGKTDALLMDFAQFVGKGFGREWRGVLFRRTFPELADVIEKSEKWFHDIFPAAQYNKAEHTWTFPDGEKLLFRHYMKPGDYWSYHGHAYPWQGWEELTTWPDDTALKAMFSCARSTVPGLPIRVRATSNPYGVGHNWVKARYRLPIQNGKVVGKVITDSFDESGEREPPRVAIHGYLKENRILLTADPGYIQRIKAAASNAAQLKAWIDGDWDIVAGGMFDDVWNNRVHVVPAIPLHLIPRRWKITRSYDHGSSKPFSVGWWTISNGEPFEYQGHVYGLVKGDCYRIAEWYGCGKKPNTGLFLPPGTIAQGIRDREFDWQIQHRVKRGQADSAISSKYEGAKSVQSEMAKKDNGAIKWDLADKGPGSRKQGWEIIRQYLQNALPNMDGYRSEPGLFVFDTCHSTCRTLPVLPRDETNMDDVDTESEDHIGDDVRYFLRRKSLQAKQKGFR